MVASAAGSIDSWSGIVHLSSDRCNERGDRSPCVKAFLQSNKRSVVAKFVIATMHIWQLHKFGGMEWPEAKLRIELRNIGLAVMKPKMGAVT